MTSAEIRQSFLDFFKSKEHTLVPSSPLLPASPNLLFTNAGMNQFVPIFLGERRADVSTWAGVVPGRDTRAADTQKCIRAGGKHNDLEDVGLDTYHHTFFEMLGNWSFGDYFKKESLEWGWELLTKVWGFPPARLYATVYSPDKSKGDPADFDQEAWDIWAGIFRRAGLDPAKHIVRGNKKDNFWMMGDTGPCGPCSEIHVDLTPAGDTAGALVNAGDARCIEIWNHVFIQFNANPDGTFSPLPAKHVDTGMGFERVVSIIQCTQGFKDFANAKISNYETDIFRPIFDELEKLSGKKYAATLPGNQAAETTGSGDLPEVCAVECQGSGGLPKVCAVDGQGSAGVPPAAAGVPPAASGPSYHKRRLPHFERPWGKYMVTFSTKERHALSPEMRDLVLKSLIFGHEQRRYHLYAACVMPDHVHMLLEPQMKEQTSEGAAVFWPLTEILHGIKSFTAHEINKAESRTGPVWENESFDRLIRSEGDLLEKFHYICRNPWEAGVVKSGEEYSWLWTPGPKQVGDTEGAARDAQPGGRDARAPQTAEPPGKEQIQLDVAFRVIADHIRTCSFAIADGILPGNSDRNYVIRRILRRAVRYGRTLGFSEPFFYKLVDVLAEKMGHVFPEIRAKQQQVKDALRQEEEAFNRTLENGLAVFDEIFRCVTHLQERMQALYQAVQAQKAGDDQAIRYLKDDFMRRGPAESVRLKQIGGDELQISFGRRLDALTILPTMKLTEAESLMAEFETINTRIAGGSAFLLYDTYGFPLDLTELLARERGLTVDVAAFNGLMEEQRSRARASQKKTIIELSQIETKIPTHFVGFEHEHIGANVQEVAAVKDRTVVVVNNTVCYAEMGGQVGDTGELADAGKTWRITDTRKSGNTWLHFIEGEGAPSVGEHVTVRVDRTRRAAIERHHTVTHLLHWALHEVVSRDAAQKGSYVGPDKLTFDFNSAALTPAQIADIEKLVNTRIAENAPVTWGEFKYADVKERREVMQFFGDKYGETVRIVQIGGSFAPDAHHRPHPRLDGYSMELCGGTHVRATGDIGLFKILHEGAVAAGVRRIEAVAGEAALNAARALETEARELAHALADGSGPAPTFPSGIGPNATIESVQALEQKVRELKDALAEKRAAAEKQKRAEQRQHAAALADTLAELAVARGDLKILAEVVDVPAGELRGLAMQLGKKLGPGVVVLGTAADGKVGVVALCSPEAVAAGHNAGRIVGEICGALGGKGGGKPDFAQGGAKDAAGLPAAVRVWSEK